MKTKADNNNHCDTLITLFEQNKNISDKGITFIQSSNLEVFVSYSQLYNEVLLVLGNLQREGIPQGSEIVFQIDDNRQFITLFWACILGKLIPVPLAVGNQHNHRLKFLKVWECLDNPYLISDVKTISQISRFISEQVNGSIVSVIEDRAYDIRELLNAHKAGEIQKSDSDDIAFIQFSSGSTGDPKGVIIKHRNVIVNLLDLISCSSATAEDSTISWMPLSHDMGLICIYLKGFMAQMNQYLIPTSVFIRRPLLWIDKASEYNATELYSPNFGFKYCMSSMRDSTVYNWDLSNVRVIYNGAEPISKQLCDDFTERLDSYGLSAYAMYPVYGLAEATVGVAIPKPPEEYLSYTLDRNSINLGDEIKFITNSNSNDQITFVDVGFPLTNCNVRICNEYDNDLGENKIGLIQISGPNVTSGYYNNEIATQKLLSKDGWVKTGDLGFMINGRLVITGRLKNIIIINGQNYYPQDIEGVVIDEIDEIELGKIVAVSILASSGKAEKLAVFVMFKKPVEQFCFLVEKIKEVIFDRLRITAEEVIPIKKIPKTTSGKIKYYQLQQQFLNGEFDKTLEEINAFFTINDGQKDNKSIRTKDQVSSILKEILNLKEIDPNEDLFDLGVNSMVATKLIAQIQNDHGIELSLHELFGHVDFETFNIKAIAAYIDLQSSNELEAVPALSPQKNYEVSYAQKRLWLLDNYNDGQNPSSIPVRMIFKEDFKSENYQKTWEILVARHESLRTIFITENEDLRQQILPVESIDIKIEFLDIRGEKYVDELIKEISFEESRYIFNLDTGPLFKLKVIRSSDREFHCMITIHHIVSDGWSTGILLNELNEVYDSLKQNRDIQLPELTKHYKDFAAWQNQTTSPKIKKNRDFWLTYLQGEIPIIELPTYSERPDSQTYKGKRLTFRFSKATYSALCKLGNEKDSTRFMTLISVLNLLFYKYTGLKDVVLGTSVADRSHPAVQEMVGYFLNVIALRTAFKESNTFIELLENTRDSILKAYEHQDYPFEKVVHNLGIERDPSRSPVFDVVVLFHNYDHSIVPPEVTVEGGQERIVYETDNGTSIVDLFFEFMEYKDQLFLNIRYNTDLFHEDQINALVDHFENLMNAVLVNPKNDLGQYKMIGEDEVKQINQLNSRKSATVVQSSFIELFEKNVTDFSSKAAIEFNDYSETYSELNANSNKLANFIISKFNINSQDLIAVVMPRSAQYLESILAIWKAGAIYLPISDKNPFGRVLDIISDSNVSAVISDSTVFDENQIELIKQTADVIVIDDQRSEIEKQPSGNSNVVINPDDVAYIIYTSGSTGKAKGVMVEHQGMINHLIAKIEDLSLDQNSIISQNASQDFDISIWQFLVALLTGGKTIIYNDSIILDPEKFIENVKQDQVTILEVVPSYLSVVLSLLESNHITSSLSSLQFMIVTGEVLNANLVKRWFKHFPGIKMMNAYGPTEASDDITHYIMEADPGLLRIPIGKPVRNMSIYIVDEYLQLCPKGVKGEICVSGIGVGKGYLNDEVKTKFAFVKNPFGTKNGDKLYKTGDIGRYLPDGTIEFFGRKDQQVKIHGHRIELGEIENRLTAIEKVEQAVVIVNQSDLGNDEFLTAFIVFKKGQKISQNEIQTKLSDKLPDYMVPQIVNTLDELPLTANGKVDRKKLTIIGLQSIQNESETALTLPINETEEQLLNIWKSVLQLDCEIGTNDNFFRIGGYSLLANQVSIKVQQEIGVKLEMKQLFLYPTIRQLAQEIEKSEKSSYQSIPKVQEKPYYTLSNAQRRLWILYQMEEKQTAYNVYGAYRFPEKTDKSLLEKAILSVVGRHEILRTTIKVVDGIPYQKIQTLEKLKFKIVHNDFSKEKSQAIDVYDRMNKSLEIAFDLENGPLLKAIIYTTQNNEIILFLVIHHIISDGWSRGVFENEIITNYASLINGKSIEANDLEINYKDYAEWQNDLLENDKLSNQEKYWVNLLTGELPKLELPYKQERPAKQTFSGKTLSHSFSPELTEKIEQSIKDNESTLFITFMTAIYLFFHKKTGQKDIIIGTAVAGRGKSELENLIGFFVNTLALRQKIDSDSSFIELHQSVKDMILDGFKNDDYPFDKLVDQLDLARDLSRSPIFDVLVEVHQFTELADSSENIEKNNLSIQPIDIEENVSIYDLSYVFFRNDKSLELKLQYNTDLFEYDQAKNFIEEFEAYLDIALRDSSIKLRDINLYSKQEILEQLPYREGYYPENKSIVELIEAEISKNPERAVISYEDYSVSYSELSAGVNRISNFLLSIPDAAGGIAGIMCDRSPEMIMSIIAVWKAGMAYLPLDADLPVNRLKFMSNDSNIKILISCKKYLSKANQLQWEANSIDHFLCVDSTDIYNEEEPLNESMKRELWEYIGEIATNEIEGGGWISSYTGLPIPKEQMVEYRENTYEKLKDLINKDSKVLEIGCASGITMFRIAPLVKKYFGTDLSSVILEKNEAIIAEKRISNIELANLYAHEIDQINESHFDLIIINSVIQNFNGLNYLRNVLKKCTNLLSDNGVIFLGDVMDLGKKDELIKSLNTFKKQNEGLGYQTKIDWEDELFVSKKYFDDLKFDIPEIVDVSHSSKKYTIENELSLFRYDTLLKINSTSDAKIEEKRFKYQYDYKSIQQVTEVHNSVKIDLDDLAYVIYTSGSTGNPKGARVRHGGMLNHLYAKISDLSMDEKSVIVQNASHSFDISVWQFFSCLLIGGKVIVYSNELVMDSEKFIKQVAIDKPTILQLVPSYLTEIFLISDENQNVDWTKNLRYLVVTGEELTKSLAIEWFKRHDSIPMVNAYGPTEASDDITHYIMDKLPDTDRVSIGSPIQNTMIYILDESNRICPVGVKGEICVTGVAVGSGYINNKLKTDQVFIENTIQKELNYEIYKTGDIGKFNFDGTLEFYGRKDYQTKIRGYRIELGEIEHSLLKIDEIGEAIVLESKDAGGASFLTGFYTVKESLQLDQNRVRAYLSGDIPEYMIPSELYRVNSMPLNRNGKIDRKALSNLIISNTRKIAEPGNELEHSLLVLWKRILDKDIISVKDSFFEIGGHSLKATRLVSLIHKELDFKISLRDVFNFPTIEQMAGILNKDKVNSFDSIPKSTNKEYYDLSHAQKRIWVLSQIGEGTAAYTEHGGVEIQSMLAVDKFCLAVNSLIARHESLRTSFKVINGVPKQHIHVEGWPNFLVKFKDLRNEKDTSELVKSIIEQRSKIGFDLENGPLIDALLIQLTKDRYYFLYSVHHIVSDGWSGNVFLKDIESFYYQHTGIAQDNLPKLAIQYKDFAEWQNSLIEEGKFREHKEFWENQLDGEIPAVELPVYKRRPPVFTNRGETLSFKFSKQLSKDINYHSQQSEVSLFMTLVAVFNVLINRYTSLSDITLGTSIAGRENLNLENQIGFYLNTVVLRNKLDEVETFNSLLKKVKENVLNAIAYQEYPFDMVIEDLKPKRDISRSPIFDILIELQNYDSTIESQSDVANELKINPLALSKNVSQLDLNLSFFEIEDEINLNIVYNTDIYESQQIKNLVAHFQVLASQLIGNPNEQIRDHDFLLLEEKQLLKQLNETSAEINESVLLHQEIEKMALIHPERIAIAYNETLLTYGELNKRANKLARLIRDKLHNESSETKLIGVLLDRTELTAITILAIWKCGYAYIPLDKEYPKARIKSILSDYGKVPLVITESDYNENEIQEYLVKLTTVIYADSQKSYSVFDDRNLNLQILESDLSYVIFTSGSTGKPKGAMIEHAGMLNHMYAKIEDLRLTEHSVVAQTASLTFDISVWQLFAALIKGGKTIVYDKEAILSPLKFSNQLTNDQVTILEVVPSYLSTMLDVVEISDQKMFDKLAYLLVTGEIVKPEMVNRWLSLYADIRIVNAYGPTEASDDITHFIIDAPVEQERVPIGYPIRNTNIYILDNHLNQCPVGVKGEICVSGIGVGRGYINDEERTIKVFLNDPFTKGKSQRMYRTGDFGRILPEGVIEIYGRQDSQVKIKGYRIELGEIESAINSLNGIKDCAVKVFENHKNEPYLCGFITTDQNSKSTELIKSELTSILPDYMVPVIFVELDRLPLTENGKVDRKALKKPEFKSNDATVNEEKTLFEKTLAETWESVLGITNVSLSDNFFDAGGDSISAIQISSSLYKKGYKIEVKDIFGSPVLSDQAQTLQTLKIPADQSEVTGDIPLTPIQKEFFEMKLIDQDHYNLSVMLQFDHQLETAIISDLFHKLQEHHDILRAIFTQNDSSVSQTNQPIGLPLSIDFIQLDYEEEKTELLKYANVAQAGIDIEKGPLMKIVHFRVKSGDQLLVIVHHLIIDVFSWIILLEDLDTLLNQYSKNQLYQLPLKTHSFQHWANKLQSESTKDSLLEILPYWKEVNSKIDTFLKVDLNGYSDTLKDSESISIELSEDDTKLLLEKANIPFNTNVTDLILIGFMEATHSKFNTTNFSAMLESYGRDSNIEGMDIERTIGWFTQEYPVVFVFSENDEKQNRIKQVKESMRKAASNGLAYNLLQLGDHMSILNRKKPQIRFNYLGTVNDIDSKLSFEVSMENTGAIRSVNGNREFDFEVVAKIQNAKLVIEVDFNPIIFKSSEIKDWFNECKTAIKELIHFCANYDRKELTPSDLSYDDISIDELDALKGLF